MSSKRHYVIMMGTKDSDRHGEPYSVSSYLEEEKSLEEIKDRIANWKDEKARPVLIEDELIIKLFDELWYREELDREKTELYDFKMALRQIVGELENMAW